MVVFLICLALVTGYIIGVTMCVYLYSLPREQVRELKITEVEVIR